MQRRDFLKASIVGAGGFVVANSVWSRVFADPVTAVVGADVLGPLNPSTGIEAPAGYVSREIARATLPVRGASGQPVGPPGHTYPVFPDGAHCFPKDDGGWILVVNSENPPGADFPFLEDAQNAFGGASAIVFDADGGVVDAYRVLGGTRTNCAGGATPWGTWLSCEEYDETEHVPDGAPPPFAQGTGEAGRVWECDPTGQATAQVRDLLGHFKHEAAAFDDVGRVYLTEDIAEGCVYRFTPDTPGDLSAGVMHALRWNADDTGTWVGPIDPLATTQSTRFQVAEATGFAGGEGCWFAPHGSPGDGGVVYFTVKGDNTVRAYDTAAGTVTIVYPNNTLPPHILGGVDNIIVSPWTGKAYVSEDGDTMEVVALEQVSPGSWTASAIARFTGPQHGLVGVEYPGPLPLESEVTSICLSPDGTRMYLSSQREMVLGATYELQAPSGITF